jgi:2'-5' RNA ligase
MRLFVALDLNTKVVANVTELVRRLAPIAPIRWVHPQNMHVTLKYIGKWDEDRLDDVVDTLGQVRVASKVKVSLAGLGFFPSDRRPHVFWVTAENAPSLRKLASSVDTCLTRLGIAPEVRPYFPHLTLGRLPSRCDLTEMHEAIEELPSRDFGHIEPESFTLYGSRLTRHGPVHTKIEEFPFLMRIPGNSKNYATRMARRL